MSVPEPRTSVSTRGLALIVGTRLLGTLLILALRVIDVEVLLFDTPPTSLALVRDMGTGILHGKDSSEPQAVVVATSPDVTAEVVVAQLSAHPSAVVTDVASAKERVVTEVRFRTGAQARRYVGSHLMTGRERSGVGVADCNLFAGRPWVVVDQDPDPQAELVIRNLAIDVGAIPVCMGATEHDAAVAIVSHVPQLAASFMAARLEELGEGALALSGQGFRDVIRIAASDPRLWPAIIAGNAGPVVDLLRQISDDLAALVTGIEAAVCDPDSPEHTAPGTTRVVAPGVVGAVTDVMTRGNLGRARIPGRYGGAPRRYVEAQVLIPDAAGELGRLSSDIGVAGVNIEDFFLEYLAGQSAGIALISVLPAAALRPEEAPGAQRWRIVAG